MEHTYRSALKYDSFAEQNKTETLFIPGMFGQWNVWKKQIAPIATTVNTVVQMGNFIGFNESISAAVNTQGGARSFDSVLSDNIVTSWAREDNWVQLIGPNEIVSISDKSSDFLDDRALVELRNAFFDKKSPVGFKIAHEHNGKLVTCGGLTFGMWEEIGRPKKAKKAAELLNKKFAGQLWLGDSVRTGTPPNLSANPVFADDIFEVYPSWIYAGEKCPFSQVFAQTLNSKRGQAAMRNELSPLYWLDKSCFLFPRFGSIVTIRDTQFFGLDVALNTAPRHGIDSARKLWVETSF